MNDIGQYKTENEIAAEIKELEAIADKGELTLPMARHLSRLKAELETIRIAKDRFHKPWPILNDA